jgi:hypothetical protein
MSLFRTLLILAVFGLASACSDMSVRTFSDAEFANLANIEVQDVKGRSGQLYTRQLQNQLAVKHIMAPTHQVVSAINASSANTLSIVGSSSTLKKMTMTASFELINIDTGEVELSESLSTNATLGAVTSYFGQDESEANGRERLAKLLADRVAQRIRLHFLTRGS